MLVMDVSSIKIKKISSLRGGKDYKVREEVQEDLIEEFYIYSSGEICSLWVQSYDRDEILLVDCDVSELSNLIIFGSKIAKIFNVKFDVSLCEKDDEGKAYFTSNLEW
jgi:hypothetical protein